MLGILRTTVLGIVGSALICKAASACSPPIKFDINDIERADVVVTGSIKNYQVVTNLEARERRDRKLEPLLERYPNPPLRKSIGPDSEHRGDYVRFDIEVDDILLGSVEPGLVPAVWLNSNFGLSTNYPSGPFLIALRAMPPLTGQIAEALRPESNSWLVLQSPCSQPFIFGSTDSRWAEVRRILGRQQWPSYMNLALLVLASIAAFALYRRRFSKAT